MTNKKNEQDKLVKNFSNKTLGILGGGQLGKMIAIAASRLGINTSIYDPDKNAPAFQNANKAYCSSYCKPFGSPPTLVRDFCHFDRDLSQFDRGLCRSRCSSGSGSSSMLKTLCLLHQN